VNYTIHHNHTQIVLILLTAVLVIGISTAIIGAVFADSRLEAVSQTKRKLWYSRCR